MRNLAIAFALTMFAVPASASDPNIFVAISAERASSLKDLAECEAALGGPDKLQGKAVGGKANGLRGSVFNRNAGNTSRCEVVDGEPLIVVYPKGYEEKRTTR